ncbi:MAG: alpha/beta hydrolase [Pseudomonadota bacterium]
MKKHSILAFCQALVTALLISISASALAGEGFGVTPQDSREFFVDESKLPFDEFPGLPSQRYWGVFKKAGYRIEIPANWNGDLVMYTHGFRGTGAELTVDNPPIRTYLLANGFAWAASSYSTNYYDVRSGVLSTNALARLFAREFGEPRRLFITGFSMGGHVATAAVELGTPPQCDFAEGSNKQRKCLKARERVLAKGTTYDGAAPFCGVMGDTELFDYFGDFGYTAETLAGWPSQFPPPISQAEYQVTALPFIISQLFADNGAGFPQFLTERGEQLKALTREISGGERPTFDLAFPVFQQLLFGFTGADGTVDGVLTGNVFDNTQRTYQLDGDPNLNNDELLLNASIIRIARDGGVNRASRQGLERVPVLTGQIEVPMVSVHTLGDLFVPFSMQQIYANRVAAAGNSDWLVSRAVRDVGHCSFSPGELIEAFADMVQWVETGVRPAGDAINDAATVAAPDFGCQFTRGDRLAPFVADCSAFAE